MDIIAVYVETHRQLALAVGDKAAEWALSDRLDHLWYDEMSVEDRIEADRRLRALLPRSS
jgi:hypothetical protein